MVVGSVNLIPESPISDVVDLARQADSLGFARCWVYDEGLATRDVYVTMAAIADGTAQIAIGPGITNPYTRQPAQTAAAIASLDELSGGRAFLGLGAGGSLTLDPLGIKRRQPLAALEETIDAARALFGGDQVDRNGEHVVLDSARLPFGRRDIEIWLAGRGPRILRLGGAVADGVMLDFLHRDALGDAVELVRAGATEAGRTARVAYSTSLVTTDDDLEFVRPHMTYRLVDAPAPIKELIGLSSSDSSRIREALAGGLDEAAQHVRDEWVLPFVIAGTSSECGDTLGRLMEQFQIEEFVLPVFEMPDPAAYLDRVATVLAVA